MYVWFWSTNEVVVLVASWTSSALSSTAVAGRSPVMPSGPGWLVARVRIMKLVGLPGTNSGSSSLSGIITVPPPLVVRSRPWSKNCPKIVNSELNGADSPTSGATFGIDSVPLASGTAPSPAAATAAGLVGVWSTIRLLTTRGCESTTVPFFWVYDVPFSAARKRAGALRGKTVSAAPNFDLPANRLLQVPSTVRSPHGSSAPCWLPLGI